MKENQLNTPPSSMQGDEVDEVIPIEDMEEMEFDDDEELVEVEEEFISEEEGDLAPPEDLAAVVFDKHVGSVFCCDLHPEGKLAATGGEDDKAYVWSVENGQVVMDCNGHKDSVIFVGFSFDGAYFASADMSGVIKVWKCDQHQENWPIAFEYEMDDIGDTTWGLWHYKSRVLIFGMTNGNIFLFKIPSGDLKVLQGSNSRVECGKLFPDGVRLAAGYDDGTVKIWDLKANSVLHQLPANSHSTQIVAIDTHPENNLMVSLSSEGKVVLTASLSKKIVNQLEIEDDLEVAAFTQDPELRYLALGTLKGAVRIWDVARQITRHHIQPGEGVAGVTKMIWVNNYLVTGCLDGALRIYEGRSGEQTSLTGHQSEVLDLCYNEKVKIILSTSDDGTARIFVFNKT